MGGAAADASLGTLSGVIVPTCENMWGVLIFLRFFYVVGHAGVWQSLVIVFVSFLSSFFTTMSLSAMATNGPVEAGGAYYIISRALGHKLGGAVGTTYFFGLSLLAVLEVLGAVEVMLYVEPNLDMGMNAEGAVRVWAIILMSALAGMVYGGMKLVSQLGLFFAAVVGLTLASYYAGLIAAPMSGVSPAITGLSTRTLSDNWGPGYSEGVTFSDVLSVFFPCFTGILAGANRANSLKRPEVSIPWGTLAAISISAVMYSTYMIMWGAVADRAFLKGGPGAVYAAGDRRRRLLAGGGDASMGVVSEIAWPLALPTQIGIIIASLSQALQCLISAPRVLNAIAKDGTVPFLNIAAPLNAAGEPAAALGVTVAFCLVASMIGSLDLVAPLLSICFLSAYAALNFATFALGLTKAPSWRPTWRYFHWSLGLAGFLVCTVLAFVIRWYFALVAVALLGALVAYIETAGVRVDWGSALGGIRLDLATSAMLDLAHERKHSSNWRPQLLCLPGWPYVDGALENETPESKDELALEAAKVRRGDALLGVAAQLKKGRGLCVVAEIERGNLSRDRGVSRRVGEAREALERRLAACRVRGFPHVLVAPDHRSGKAFAIQGLGFGGLEPNTVLLGWPRRNRVDFDEDADEDDDGDAKEEAAMILVETVCECTAAEKAVLLCLGLESFPDPVTPVESGFVDVWWVVHDGGLLLMIAHLLLRHKTWEKCRLRVHTVLQNAQDPAAVRRSLQAVLKDFRIDAEVSVVEAGDDADMYAYTHDWTMRKEQAEMFSQQLLAAQKRANAPSADADDPESSAVVSSAEASYASTPGTRTPGAETPPLSRASLRGEDADAPLARQSSVVGGSALKRAFPSEIDMLVLAHEEVEDPEAKDLRHLRRNSSRQVMRKENADGTSPVSNAHASLSSIFDMTAAAPGPSAATRDPSPLSPVPASPPPTIGESFAAPHEVRVTIEEGEASAEEAEVAASDEAPSETRAEKEDAKRDPKPKKEQKKKAVSFGERDVTRTYSPTPLPNIVPEEQKSWVMDESGPAALNRIIHDKSKDAKLVIVNLPDPDAIVMANPAAYARYTEALVRGLPRVIFVHGTGREVYTSAE